MSKRRLDVQREAYRQALAETLEGIVAALARRPEVQQVILFGSYAEGRADLLTDLDLLIVIESPHDFVTRTAELYRDLESSVDLDLLVYTPEELERNRHRPFIRRVLEKGRVLYEKTTA